LLSSYQDTTIDLFFFFFLINKIHVCKKVAAFKNQPQEFPQRYVYPQHWSTRWGSGRAVHLRHCETCENQSSLWNFRATKYVFRSKVNNQGKKGSWNERLKVIPLRTLWEELTFLSNTVVYKMWTTLWGNVGKKLSIYQTIRIHFPRKPWS